MPSFTNDPVVSQTTTDAAAILGESDVNEGVRGVSHGARVGVVGINDWAPAAPPGAGANGGWFESAQGEGVRGWAKSAAHGGVVGVNTAGGFGIYGESDDGIGVVGESKQGEGVHGTSHGARPGVVGVNDWAPAAPAGAGGNGGWFESSQGEGVRGWAKSGAHGGVVGVNTGNGVGVFGQSGGGPGVWGTSEQNEGVHAETNSPSTSAIAAYNLAPNGTGAALYAKKAGSIGHAGFFDGEVHVTGSVTVEGDVVLRNADCAEEFTVGDPDLAQPGTVMVIGDGGVAFPCTRAYDHRVIGVVSGAGAFRPALLLDRQGGPARRPIALMGKVFCQVDAAHGAIRPGDLLTTSSTPGHAMRATDATRALGTMIGKALAPLDAGRGLIPIVAILQ